MFDELEENMNRYDVRIPLRIDAPIAGNRIVETLKQYAEQEPDLSYEKRETENPELFRVGLSSEDPTRHIIVCIGNDLQNRQINPNNTYRQAGIGYYEWPGVEVNAVGYTGKGVREELENIRDGLERLLK